MFSLQNIFSDNYNPLNSLIPTHLTPFMPIHLLCLLQPNTSYTPDTFYTHTPLTHIILLTPTYLFKPHTHLTHLRPLPPHTPYTPNTSFNTTNSLNPILTLSSSLLPSRFSSRRWTQGCWFSQQLERWNDEQERCYTSSCIDSRVVVGFL